MLSLLERRVRADWQTHFGHPLLLLETFVDPSRFHGGVYRAANWIDIGQTQGYRRVRGGYSSTRDTPKRVFVRPLQRDARHQLVHAGRHDLQLTGAAKMTLNAAQMGSLPECFASIPDPRTKAGRRHRLPVVLALAAAASLCGMKGYKGMAGWAQSLGQKARERFGCRKDKGIYHVPSESTLRLCLLNVDPEALDTALAAWNKTWAVQDTALAMDGKTMRNALDEDGHQVHIASIIGHETGLCHAQKKLAPCR